MNFAVVEIAGKQYLVEEGGSIETPTLAGAGGDLVTFPKVLLYWNGENIALGRPTLDGYAVKGRITGFGKTPKIIVYKYKRRKDSHRKLGHRQGFCTVEIEKIILPGQEDRVESDRERPPVEKKAAKKKTVKKKPEKKKPVGAKGTKKRKPASAAASAAPKKTAGKPKSSARKKSSGK
ncbi:MAG: 50S ribosomal protein L21 [PVC group bacterium]